MTATRPAADAPIETAWGQEIHDAVNTPRGGSYRGSAVTGIATTNVKLSFTTVLIGGSWIDTGDILIPASAAGLYAVHFGLDIAVVGGVTSALVQLEKNAVAVEVNNYQSVSIVSGRARSTVLIVLAGGDRLSIQTRGQAATSGMAAAPALMLARIGEAFATS